MPGKPSKGVLKERIAGHEALRRQQEMWERDRRIEDREDRRVKDEELNGVRLQLRDQQGTFASKDLLNALEHSLDLKIDTLERTLDAKIDTLERSLDAKIDNSIERLNVEGTEGFRENQAAVEAREAATKEILATVRQNGENSAANRRWLIGISVAVAFGIIGNAISVAALILHLLTQ